MTDNECVLLGGSRAGEVVCYPTWCRTIYLQKRISTAESEALRINATTSWHPPDDVYERNANGVFEYQRTVHYKPDGTTVVEKDMK